MEDKIKDVEAQVELDFKTLDSVSGGGYDPDTAGAHTLAKAVPCGGSECELSDYVLLRVATKEFTYICSKCGKGFRTSYLIEEAKIRM